MSRVLVFVVLLAIVLATVIGLRNYKSAYELLPANLNKPMEVQSFSDWQTFNSQQGHFKVDFPTLPQHMTESVPDIVTKGTRKYEMYIAQKADGSSFMVSLITYSKQLDADEGKLIQDKLIDEWVNGNPKNVLKESTEMDFAGHAARQFTIENDQANIESRVFLENNTLYLLTYLAQKEYFNKADYDHFVNSFQLVKE
jgi:hypothetical protein